MPIVRTLLSQAREMGVGIWANEQNPASVADAWWSNVGTVVALPLSNARDIRTVYSAIGATREQEEAAYRLQPGEAIVKTARLRDLHRITIPLTPRTKFVAPNTLDQLMAAALADLDRYVIPTRPRDKGDGRARVLLNEREHALIECALSHPDWALTRIYEAIGLTPSSGHALRKGLEKKGCIRTIRTNLGKNRSSMLCTVVNQDILEALGIELDPGRGHLHHTFWQRVHKAEGETLGFRARIEGGRAGIGAADVLFEKNGVRVADEVAVSSKPSQEVNHIDTDLHKLGMDFVVMTFLSLKHLEQTRALAQARYDDAVMARVRFCLVTEFAKTLGEIAC